MPFTRFECSLPFTRFECSLHFTRFECSLLFTRCECSFRAQCVAWHPSSTHIAVASADASIYLWGTPEEGADVKDPVGVLKGHDLRVNKVGNFTRFECSSSLTYLHFTRFECSYLYFTRFECSYLYFTRFECGLGLGYFLPSVWW